MRPLTLLALLLTLCAAGAIARSHHSADAALDTAFTALMQHHHLPGVAIGIIKDGKLTYAKGFGTARLEKGENGTPTEVGASNVDKPITTRSLFHMASVTKPFVATAIMQLVEQRKIDLDAPLVKYLPYFRLADDRYRSITIRQMLNHTSGIPEEVRGTWEHPEYDDGALERYVRSLTNLSMTGAPGEKFAYSSMAFDILGDVIAKVSGQTFEDYVRQNIFKPLGMNDSTLLLREANPALLTSPHVKARDEIVVSRAFPYNRTQAPSSTLYSNIEDMSRFIIANLNRGELDGHRILQVSTCELMWKPVTDAKVLGNLQIGLTWYQQMYKGHRLIIHSGGDIGFESLVVFAPDDAAGLVMMTNFGSEAEEILSEFATIAVPAMIPAFAAAAKPSPGPASASTPGPEASVDGILDRYVAAIGGADVLKKFTSRVSKGTVEVEGFAIKGAFEMYEKAPNKVVMTMNVPGQAVLQQGFDGNVAWENDPDTGITEESGGKLTNTRRESEFYLPLRLHQLYPKLAVQGRERLKETDCVVLVAPRNGAPKRWYFDAQSGLLLRVEDRNMNDKTVSSIDYGDYRAVDGLKLPFSMLLNEGYRFVVKLTEIKQNVAIDDAKFAKPVK